EYSAERARLAELGWSVGTVFAALPFAELLGEERRRGRLRQLPLEAYMVDIDDGWVLRQARSYRGRVQIEGEEAAGESLLLGLMSDVAWTADNFLLVRELTRVVPHTGGAQDLSRDLRRGAIELAEIDASFQGLRAEIHGAPSESTAARVRQWARGKSADAASAAANIADMIERLYGAGGRRDRLAAYSARFARLPATEGLAGGLDLGDSAAAERLEWLAAVARTARESIVAPMATAALRLELFDFVTDIEAELFITAAEALNTPDLTRGQLIVIAEDLVNAAFGTGLLSVRERDTLLAVLDPAAGRATVSLDEFATLVEALRRVPQWAAGSVRYSFAEPLVRYAALDARAAYFTDDILRSSAIVALGDITRALALDLARLTGVSQSINGTQGVSAFGLNPGVAQGTLKILDATGSTAVERTDIVVVPETTPELAPVAGIVTLGEGNPLSHVQLLARNFGIPNIAVAPGVLPLIEPLSGTQVVAAVATNGSLALVPIDALTAAMREQLTPANLRGGTLTVPPVDVTRDTPVPLSELRAALSGRVVGPKAANLGELARLFPGRVAPALAIPFGIYAEQIGFRGESPRSRLADAYAQLDAGLIDSAELGELLADIRNSIAAISISPDLRAQLRAAMAEAFGPADSYGVFVRSDTNVEDLPEFTGAGLSETLPNVVGTDAIIDSIPRVWASVLSPRAIAWRSSLLSNPEQVYASVLLMKSVAADKSGVMVTTNVSGTRAGVTVSAAWGVGGGVGGEATETLVLHRDGSETLVSGAKAPYARRLAPGGGLDFVSAIDGAVLSGPEKAALRELAGDVERLYRPVLDANGRPRPWDIEYGFVDGELTLFQIRPLVERGPQLADRVVAALLAPVDVEAPANIALDARAGGDDEIEDSQ
ncbi:MAG TPA: PEP/pyruvate-binding domain-containing protein, partial [Gammaproteobacteria bacterium]|nr:PEP/pyruvate-binding domain-containing protein [Gammaproteobacteria bacterium]